MRIAVFTHSLDVNFGGILQAYALQQVLQEKGHDVTLIDCPSHWHLPAWKAPLAYSWRFFRKYVLRKSVYIRNERRLNSEFDAVMQRITPFIEHNIRRRIVRRFSEIKEGEYDALVVGSDQVWRPPFVERIADYYLNFASVWKDVHRIAYAASFGTEKWEYTPEETAVCSDLIRLFDAVSVREDSGIELCRNHLGAKVQQMPDPVMLLNADDYRQIVSETQPEAPSGNLLCCFLDATEEKTALASRIAREQGLTPFAAVAPVDGNKYPLEARIQPSVEWWLNAFNSARFILTDSYHASVFAILFDKPFVCIINKERGAARFSSIARLFDIPQNFLNSPKDYDVNSDYALPIEQIATILSKQRELGRAFLSENLK